MTTALETYFNSRTAYKQEEAIFRDNAFVDLRDVILNLQQQGFTAKIEFLSDFAISNRSGDLLPKYAELKIEKFDRWIKIKKYSDKQSYQESNSSRITSVRPGSSGDGWVRPARACHGYQDVGTLEDVANKIAHWQEFNSEYFASKVAETQQNSQENTSKKRWFDRLTFSSK